jgi:hypothetical protein
MTQRTATPVTNSHFSVHFNDRDLVHELMGVAPVLAELVLDMNIKIKTRTERSMKQTLCVSD